MSRTTRKEYYALLHVGAASMIRVYWSVDERNKAMAAHEAKNPAFMAQAISRDEAIAAARVPFGSPGYVVLDDSIRAMLGLPLYLQTIQRRTI